MSDYVRILACNQKFRDMKNRVKCRKMCFFGGAKYEGNINWIA